jgi:hypothetical protein
MLHSALRDQSGLLSNITCPLRLMEKNGWRFSNAWRRHCPSQGRNLIAAKLIEAEPKDLGDIRFLVSRYRPDQRRVGEIIAGFDQAAREKATETPDPQCWQKHFI